MDMFLGGRHFQVMQLARLYISEDADTPCPISLSRSSPPASVDSLPKNYGHKTTSDLFAEAAKQKKMGKLKGREYFGGSAYRVRRRIQYSRPRCNSIEHDIKKA
jgi:hypothetical protein